MATRKSSSLHEVTSVLKEDTGQIRSSQSDTMVPKNPVLYLPHYRFKVFKSKGAVLVLLWVFSGLFVFNFMTKTNNHDVLIVEDGVVNATVVMSMSVLIYPLFGWLADVCFGRYKMIRGSMWLMWVVAVLFCLAYLIPEYAELYITHCDLLKDIHRALRYCFYVSISIGLGGFQANIVQFGIDQLIDASSTEITSFIRWFTWMWFLSGFLVTASQNCFCKDYELISFLFLPVCLTFALCIDYIFSGWLVKEPVSKNPLVLIIRVLKYALKNKFPRQRSAFTYWDDKPYFRIDLAKNKYGGPFSTEEVENVKTFLRILVIIIVSALFVGLGIHASTMYDRIFERFQGENFPYMTESSNCRFHTNQCYVVNCFRRMAVKYSGNIAMIMFIPIFELILYPIFKLYFNTSILMKLCLGFFILQSGLLACIGLEFVAHNHNDNNVTCIVMDNYHHPSGGVLPLSYMWMVLPSMLNAISQFVIVTSTVEFLCAQSPYSTKGLLFGLVYGTIGVFTIIGFCVLYPVKKLTAEKLSSTRHGCGVWYLLIVFSILFACFIFFYFICKWYKKRLRDDNQHNEQIFAVNYYSHYSVE